MQRAIQYLRGQDEGGGGQKMSVFVHAQDIKTVHAGGEVKKGQSSIHVVVECPQIEKMINYYF